MSNLKRKATSGGQGGPPPAKSVKTSKATRPSNSDAASQMPPVKAAAPLVSLLKNDEPIFPRGGGHVLTPLEQKNIQLEAEADVRQEGEFDTGNKTRRTTKLKPQLRKEKDEKKGSQDTIKIESLNFKKLVKGSLVLGQVSRINSLNLEIALPYNLTGHVSIVAISDQLTNRLRDGTSDDTNDRGSSQEDAEDDDDDDSRIDLKYVFSVGQYLRVCVLSTMDDAVAGKNRRKIELSIRPAEANCGLTMEDIVPYSTVMASIVSVEDRGCIMDLGIPGARAFLPADEIDPAIAPERLQPGVVFLCHASGRRSGSRVAQLSLLPEKLGSVKNAPAEATTINTYLPGTLATLLVSHVSTRGIGGKIMGNLDATADLVHSGAGPDGTDLASTYNVGSKVKVRIICNFAAAKDPKLGVSLLPHVVSLARKHADSDTHNLPTTILPISSLVKECKVRLAEVEIGLYVDTGIAGLPGFVHISRVKDTKVDALYEASGPYQVGSVHRGRVIGYSELDGLFHISFQESILAQQYIRIEDVPIGGLVSCDIEKLVITEDGVSGLIVKIADGVTGLVTERHMSDVRLQHPEKKFRQGMKVKARVLSSDLSKRRMRLTLKKALVNSEAPIIKAFDEVAVGMHVPGTIVKLQKNGAHIRFYGSLQGFLPVSEMSEAYIRNPVDYFHFGQVISVHVLEVDPDRKRLIVSCKDPTAFGLEKQNALKTLQLGELVSAKVTQKTEEHVHVELEGSQLKAILPMGHLTHKSLSKNKFALKRISVGQTLSGLLVIDKDEKRRAIILSQKPSLIQASKDGKFPSSFDDVSIDDILSGYVRNISQTAVFVQFSGSLHALLPRSRLSAEAQSQADFGLTKDDSIMVRVISVIPDLRRIAVAPAESGSEAAKPQDRGSAPADGLSTGSIVQVRISSLKQTQLNVQLVDSKAQGRIDISQVFDCWDSIPDTKRPLSRFHRNQELRARVIGVHSAKDHRFLPLSHRSTHSVIELTAKPSDLEAETPHPLSLESFKVGDSFIGFVNNVTPRCLWVNVSPNVRGRVSAMDALDDISQLTDLEANFPVGSALKVTVKSVDVQNKKLDLSGRSSGPLKALTWDALKPNMTLPGIVVKVDESQVFIRLSPAISGTLSIPDMVDNYDEANTLDYHKGDICRVSIVEVDRDKKRVRLSTRPSRIMSFMMLVVDKEVSSFSHVAAGDLIRGFVKNVSDKGLFVLLGGQITAMVKIRNLSDKFLKDWQDNFQVNQLVKGRVLCVNAAARQIELSLRPSAVRGPCTGLMTYKDVKQGQVVEGKVRKVEEFGAFIVVDKSANVSGLCHRSQMADDVVRDATKLYKEGDAVKAVVLDVDADKRRISFALKPSLFEDEDTDMDSDDSDSGGAALVDGDVDMGVEDVVVKSQGTDNATVSRNEVSIDDDDDDDDDGSSTDKEKYVTKSAGLSIGKKSAWSANAFSDSGSGSDESDESDKDTELAKIMRKRKESKRRKKVEIEVDKTAELDAHGPRTTSDYERLLLGQPDSSELWIAYMVFQMQASELAKAREVAERAIRTINVREETEKLNVWVAYLNLEVTYGNERTVEDVFKRACVYNSDLEVHERLASIYIQSEQWKEADELFKAMVKKFGAKSPGVWINYAHFLHVTLNEPGRARSLLPRAIRQLDERHHQSTISRFAALEFRAPHGEAERGRTMFEGLLAAWPKKGDLWNQLLDLETSATGGSDAKAVRDVFERRLGVKGLKPQQAEKWFRRWAAWEENLDPEGEGKERAMAKAQDWAAAYKARKEEEGGG